MKFFKKLIGKTSDENGVRFDYPFFRDKAVQDEIRKKGYSVQPLLTPDDVAYLNRQFLILLEKLGEPLPDTHWTSGRVENTEIRNFARQSIEGTLPKRLEQYFDPDEVDFVGGIYLAKKPSAISELSAHQDSSHTDESKYPAVYAWVPLADTNERNGAMYILPGSHLWGNRYRSLNVPWAFNGFQEVLNKYLEPVYMKAGDVLFFDSAAIHYSANNLSNEIRPALNYFIKPKKPLFLHHYIDKNTPVGQVEVYHVDIDFFYNCDFMKPPPCPPYEKIGNKPALKEMTLEKLQKLIAGRNL